MAIQNPQLQGRSTLPTAIVEAAGSFASLAVAHAATDSFKFLSYTSNPTEDRQPRRDVRPGRDDISMMTRNRSNEWSVRMNFLPRLLAVPTDGYPFLTGIYGLETIGGSSVTYSYARVPPAISFIATGGEPTMVAQEKMVGCIVEERTITLAQGEEPIQEFSGVAVRCAQVLGVGAIAAGGATSATQTLGTGQAINFQVGSIIEIVGVTTTGRIISRSVSANTITLAASVTTTGAEIVRPSTAWSESSTNQGGEVISSWNAAISIGGVTTYGLVGATITQKNNHTEKRVLGSQYIADYGYGHRETTGTFTFNATDRDLHLLAAADEMQSLSTPGTLNPAAVIITLGDATNGQVVITMPNVALIKSPISNPADGNATFELGFRAMSTRTTGVPNNDSISEVWS